MVVSLLMFAVGLYGFSLKSVLLYSLRPSDIDGIKISGALKNLFGIPFIEFRELLAWRHREIQ